MTYDQGEVWWGPAPHKSSPSYRPWVIVSDASDPFSGTESIGLAMTTLQHEGGIKLPDSAWIAGGSTKTSYVSPWYVATIKHRDFDRHQGDLAQPIIATAIGALHGYTPLPDQTP